MWRAIAEDIERDIRERVLAPGDKLPSEHMLVRKYYVTRHMVRLALNKLINKGIIESHQGRGTFVRRSAVAFPIGLRTRFATHADEAGIEYQLETSRLEQAIMPPHVARAFGVKITTPGILVERLSRIDDEPHAISQHYFLDERLPGFIAAYKEAGSITEALRQCGISDYIRYRTHIISRLPSKDEAELLRMPGHVPLLITRAINHDVGGTMIEFGETRVPADRIELVIEASRFTNRPPQKQESRS
ncbi:MAG: phosphonate metabolism transcriptional regulator PhnF [Alphaproteobacteria bacterium]|nr:phosphonate metabolism transcriptional regulator PhnF [Alphaproteobacteria bacterium]